MDAANRAFLCLALLAAGAYVLLGFWGCGVLVSVLASVAADGWAATVAGGATHLWAALALGALEICVAAFGIVSVHRQLVATERLALWVRDRRVAPPDELRTLLGERRLLDRLDVVGTDEPVSFTYGFLRPRIVISRGLVRDSSPDELAAVLEHEAYHVRNLDPLKMAAARALPAALFFLPLLNDLRQHYLLGRELAADRRAVSRCGVAPLAAALSRALSVPTPFAPAAGAALAGGEMLSARVEQLETGTEPRLALSRGQTLLSITAAVALVALLVTARSLDALAGAHLHSPPMGTSMTAASVVATSACALFWGWFGWRVVRWRLAWHPRSFYYR